MCKENRIGNNREINLDKIQGSLVGGAIGDALGYPIEFQYVDSICSRYGEDGLTEYVLDKESGKALISDDTQMTLFTANGLLVGRTDMKLHASNAPMYTYLEKAYQDWFLTQERSIDYVNSHDRLTKKGGYSWLLDVPELYSRRAPGRTCLTALRYPEEFKGNFLSPINGSKGNGGIMRIAPVALLYNAGPTGDKDISEVDMQAAHIVAITHGHPLGYIPAAVTTHIINRIIYGPQMELKAIIAEAVDTCRQLFADENKYFEQMVELINKAIEFSENNRSDLDNIYDLGEGWVTEETLAISLYCALKYKDDFSKAVITAVNHNGDSDSTGAVTGNIVGAIVGYEAIEPKWKDKLELHDVILEMADDLCHDFQMTEHSENMDQAWLKKYVDMHRK